MELKALLILTILPMFFMSAYADPHLIETADTDLSVPGCLETEIGCYTPNILTVGVGHTITMTNVDEVGIHTFTSGTVDGFSPSPDGIFDSGMLMRPGDSFEWTPDTAGEYPYYCTLHVWQQGTIIVEEVDESHPVPEPTPEPDPPVEPEPVITIDELHSIVINNTSMMNGMYTDIDTIQEQNIQRDSLITSLTDIITILQDDIAELRLLLESMPIEEEQTLPVIGNFVYYTNNGNVNLSWTVDSGEPMIKYMFKWRDEPGTAWDKDIVRDAALTSWVIDELEHIEYEFAFTATNQLGESETEYFTLTP